ncbi:hypothetical protein ACM26V_00510 [Salipaludibacillus sp. HK11]|uniref:hypothetical protein n=1 Tax=Salipaludibacillus sp. HK11 TaxID=3394320 RepID=UPI0039FC0616
MYYEDQFNMIRELCESEEQLKMVNQLEEIVERVGENDAKQYVLLGKILTTSNEYHIKKMINDFLAKK